MIKNYVKFVCALAVLLNAVSFAQTSQAPPSTPKPGDKVNLNTAFERQLSYLEKVTVDLAEAMPAEKYTFVPGTGDYKDVRNFGQQLKHLSSANYVLFSGILREKPPADPGANGDGPDSLTSKAEIVAYVKKSFEYGHKAVASMNESNFLVFAETPSGPKGTSLGMIVADLTHSWDIYGQLVEYLRLNNIVPPASRPAK